MFCFKNCADLSLFNVLVFLDQLNNFFSLYVRTNFRNKVPKISVNRSFVLNKVSWKKVWRAILLKLSVCLNCSAQYSTCTCSFLSPLIMGNWMDFRDFYKDRAYPFCAKNFLLLDSLFNLLST